MSDICDRLVRFKDKVCVSSDLEVEAADEITRLRAELAAERTRHIELLDEMDACCDDRTRLRAELAAEQEHHADALEMNILLQRDKAELRAELAAAKNEIEKQRARVIKWVNAAMRNEEYDDDGR